MVLGVVVANCSGAIPREYTLSGIRLCRSIACFAAASALSRSGSKIMPVSTGLLLLPSKINQRQITPRRRGYFRRLSPATMPAPLNVVGEQITVPAPGSRTGGYEIFRQAGPEGSGPPPHYHPWDESFYVVSGNIAFGVDAPRLAAEVRKPARNEWPANTRSLRSGRKRSIPFARPEGNRPAAGEKWRRVCVRRGHVSAPRY